MALTTYQRRVCALIAANRVELGESYVAGGVALNLAVGGSRISRDIDLFHDTDTALDATWAADRKLLETNGFDVSVVRERAGFVEAVVHQGDNSVLLQWTRDSAFRFFPLVQSEEFGMVLHPFDLATNKVLALVGRLEVRDWVDLISCHDRIQRLGYLAWAACGKDPGYSPATILEHAARSCHYSAIEIQELSFEGEPPDASELSRKWHSILAEANDIIDLLPTEEAGKCVVNASGGLYTAGQEQLRADISAKAIGFHCGCIRGAYPQVVNS